MTGKERIATTMAHREPDRVPTMEYAICHDVMEQYLGHKVYWRGHMQTIQAFWEGRRDEVVESYKRDIADFLEITGADGVAVGLVPPQGFAPPPFTQLDEETWRDWAGNLYRYSALTHDLGLFKQHALDPLPEPEDQWQPPSEIQPEEWELVDYIADRFGKDKYIFHRPGRACWLGFPSGVGMEEQYIRLAEEPDKVAEELIESANGGQAEIDLAFEHGCDNVCLGMDFAFNEGPFMSPRTFERVYLPWLAEIAGQVHAHNAPLLWHSCGDNRRLLDMMIDAGVDCYQSIQHTLDIAEIKQKWGDRLALWGGFSTHSLVSGTPEDLREQVRYSVKWCAPGGGFICASSHSVCVGTRRENYAAALDELAKVGSYPIRL